MASFGEKPFRSEEESARDPAEVPIQMGQPRVRPHFSIELPNESDIEAFDLEMPDWVAFANAEFGRREHTPAEEALAEAQKRAMTLESRLRR